MISPKETNTKQPKLYLAIALDLAGMLTYFVPAAGEYADIVWAPISAWIFYQMYGGRLGIFGAMVNFIEEILPFTDFVPTFTIAWFVKKYLQEREE
ncbi:MAG: hypothetical protein LBD45_09905 [Bacteroidales bacterium]|jgi:hypothetical protein|nr:hypothetical protein [Bacteroidales bacterium]